MVDLSEDYEYNNLDEINAFIAIKNPFRYRSYYYDFETNLYYLNSRYYDPQLGRFINADDITTLDVTQIALNGLNLYAYCLNNPVNQTDDDGNIPNWLKWLLGGLLIIGLIIATIATGGAAGGVAGFIFAGALKGAIISAVTGALVGGLIGGITSYVSGNGFWSGFLNGAADGFLSGAITGALTGALTNTFRVLNAAKYWDKGNFSSGFKSMKYHYNEHVIKEGFKHGNNIVKYTKDAVNFAIRNSSNLKYFVPYNTALQPYWSWLGKIGMNGQFTSLGKILTFWYKTL